MQTTEKTHQQRFNEEIWPVRGQWKPEDLIRFERLVAEAYNDKQIRAPIHLSGGNEEPLIEAFKLINPGDWVCSTWRSHYHCLLHGVDPQMLFGDILAGKSITLCYPEHHIITSAIVGGICPIAVGLAQSIMRTHGERWRMVYCFIGDMCAHSGIFWECINYSRGHGFPIQFIVEDNGLSVCTDTAEAWGTENGQNIIKSYQYKLPFPHAGAGQRINF